MHGHCRRSSDVRGRGSPWPLLHPALLPIGQVLIIGEPAEVSDGVRVVLAVAFTVLFVAAARFFWTQDEKAVAVACVLLCVGTLVEGVLGIKLTG